MEKEVSRDDEGQIEADQIESTTEDGAASDDEEQSVESLKEALQEATTQAAENWDKFVRVQAEMDNISKRAGRDLENAHKFALDKFVNELLPVWDSLEMGLDHADGGEFDPEKLKEGHELTLKMLSQIMQKFHVVQIDPVGEVFNPEQHEAMTLQPSDEVEPNYVLAVIQKGYLLHGRLIRPARVIVARAVED